MSTTRKAIVSIKVHDDKHCGSDCAREHRVRATGQCDIFRQDLYFDNEIKRYRRCARCLRGESKATAQGL